MQRFGTHPQHQEYEKHTTSVNGVLNYDNIRPECSIIPMSNTNLVLKIPFQNGQMMDKMPQNKQSQFNQNVQNFTPQPNSTPSPQNLHQSSPRLSNRKLLHTNLEKQQPLDHSSPKPSQESKNLPFEANLSIEKPKRRRGRPPKKKNAKFEQSFVENFGKEEKTKFKRKKVDDEFDDIVSGGESINYSESGSIEDSDYSNYSSKKSTRKSQRITRNQTKLFTPEPKFNFESTEKDSFSSDKTKRKLYHNTVARRTKLDSEKENESDDLTLNETLIYSNLPKRKKSRKTSICSESINLNYGGDVNQFTRDEHLNQTIPYELESSETALRSAIEGNDRNINSQGMDTIYKALLDYSVALRCSSCESINKIKLLNEIKYKMTNNIKNDNLSVLDTVKNFKQNSKNLSFNSLKSDEIGTEIEKFDRSIKVKAFQIDNVEQVESIKYRNVRIDYSNLINPDNFDNTNIDNKSIYTSNQKSSLIKSLLLKEQFNPNVQSSNNSSSSQPFPKPPKNSTTDPCTCNCHRVQYTGNKNLPEKPKNKRDPNRTIRESDQEPAGKSFIRKERTPIIRWTDEESEKLEKLFGPIGPHDRIGLEKCRELVKHMPGRSHSQIMSRMQTLQRQKIKKIMKGLSKDVKNENDNVS